MRKKPIKLRETPISEIRERCNKCTLSVEVVGTSFGVVLVQNLGNQGFIIDRWLAEDCFPGKRIKVDPAVVVDFKDKTAQKLYFSQTLT